MPVNLPQPLFVPGGQERRSTGDQALLQLLSQLPSLGVNIAQNIQQGPQRKAELARTQQATATSVAQEANAANQVDIRTQEFELEKAALEAKAVAKAKAGETAYKILSRDPANGAQLGQAWQLVEAMHTYGLDASVIRPLLDEQLPQSEKDKLDLEIARFDLAGQEAEVDADQFATDKLVSMGLMAADTPRLPGAANTLQAILKSREGKQVNWAQEGLDFITSRIGQSLGGTGNFVMDTSGQMTLGGGAGGVSVDAAINEWRALVERVAPEGVKEAELKRIESGAWQRALTKNMAIVEVLDVLTITPQISDAEIRETLSAAYTPKEVSDIIRTARSRLSRPKR